MVSMFNTYVLYGVKKGMSAFLRHTSIILLLQYPFNISRKLLQLSDIKLVNHGNNL